MMVIFFYFLCVFPLFISNTSIVSINFGANLDAQNAGNDISQPRSQGFSLFVIGKSGKGPGTGRSSMYSDWSMTSTLLCK